MSEYTPRAVDIEPLNKYTLVHMTVGFLAQKLGIGWFTWFVVHAAFELWEKTDTGIEFFRTGGVLRNYITQFNWPLYTGDSFQNSSLDTAASMVGFKLAEILSGG